MLLEVDGLAKGWKGGKKSTWERISDKNASECTPYAITKLNRDISLESFIHQDSKELNMKDTNDIYFDKYVKDGHRVVSKMPLSLFTQCLVNHFDIRFQRNEIVWPQRIKLHTNI